MSGRVIKVLVYDDDEYCRECLELIRGLIGDDFELVIIDISRDRDAGLYYGVKSVPTIVFDEEVRIVGCPPEHVLSSIMREYLWFHTFFNDFVTLSSFFMIGGYFF